MNDLFLNHAGKSGPVECLGQTFPSDDARREYYLKLLAERLKDPSFRKIEGFPIGNDEAILALSDPPYYTACQNPFLTDLVHHYGQSTKRDEHNHIEPFTADVSEGKNDPVYNAHSYHTKVPHKAIMRYLLHYTRPGDIVFDGFSGTGMTGVAANLCADRKEIESLGYRVDSEGNVLEEVNEAGKHTWRIVSRLGVRHAVLNDLSPIAAFISSVFNTPTDHLTLKDELERGTASIAEKWGWMYRTLHSPTKEEIDNAVLAISSQEVAINGPALSSSINYTVWSDVFSCPECTGEMIFWDVALDF